jgi:hypothetical protein
VTVPDTSVQAPLSAAALLALRELNRDNHGEILKLAVKELVAARTWRLVAVERPSGRGAESLKFVGRMVAAIFQGGIPRPRWRKRLMLLVEGDSPPPQLAPLPVVSLLVSRLQARSQARLGGRELSEVARHLRHFPDLVREEVLQPLEAAGLVTVKERRAFRTTLSVKARRTPAGDARAARRAVSGVEHVPEWFESKPAGGGWWLDPELNDAFEGEFEAVFEWTWNLGWHAADTWSGV